MIDLKKVILKKDHYEFEVFMEFKNCEVLEVNEDNLFIKPDTFKPITQLKDEIIAFMKRSPQLYCDCKKIIFVLDTFEEVIKVKRNGIENISQGEKYNMNLLVYGIWFSSAKSSYGPMIKLIECKNVNKGVSFLPDPDDYCSDDEINESIKHYAKIKEFKEKNVIKASKKKVKSKPEEEKNEI